MSEEAGYPISFNEFFKAGFPIMILTTAIVSFYMVLVYVVGADGGATTWKLVLTAITLFGIIWQVARGRSKGKSFAESLVDDDSEEIMDAVENLVDIVVRNVPGRSDSEE